MAKRRQFYQLSPVCYRVSLWKEGLRKSLADRRSGFWAAELRQEESLPVIVKSHRSPVLRRLEGADGLFDGEVFYYIRTNGTDMPERLKWRVPSYMNWEALSVMMRDCAVADVALITNSIDPCVSCTER